MNPTPFNFDVARRLCENPSTVQELVGILRDAIEQLEWYRTAIAETMGYDGPAGDAVCPLREYLQDRNAFEVMLKDFADHGLRMDLNPTKIQMTFPLGVNDPAFKTWLRSEEFWHEYLKRADNNVRQGAKVVLQQSQIRLLSKDV